jgi:poly-gamma-glutamate capsule biosynthesis protein CapA/YwtB (metallophosphatase superfamily)
MFPSRSIAFMTLLLACVFSLAMVVGTILLPSLFPLSILPNTTSSGKIDNKASEDIDEDPPQPARLLFVGDIMLARGVEWQIAKNGINYPLHKVVDFLSAPDLTIGNFEGTIRPEPNQELDGFTFDTTPAIANMVHDAGIDVLSLSNNHSDNYGSTILQSTRQALSNLGFTVFGDPYNSAQFVEHVTVNDLPISFIGFHAFGEDPESILATIASEKSAGYFVIILPHWGNEYEFTPSAAQTEAAHMFVDAGADAIIGAHPHVIQTYENYQGVPIIYSLGNFLFDQDWSIPTQQGLILGFDISSESIAMTFTPISVVKSQVSIMENEDAATILSEHNLPLVLTVPR